MKIDRPARFAKAAVAAIAGLSALSAPLAAWAGSSQPYYDRTFMLAANRKCGLFQPAVVDALTAAAWQARGAALRGGISDQEISATAARAEHRAAGVSCDNPDLGVVKARVTDAFAGWSRIPRMDFRGDRAVWTADRMAGETARWRLMQATTTGASPVRFGLSGSPDGAETLTAVVSFVGRPRPYAARMVMRDPGLSRRPWLTADGAAVLPPEAARRAVWATGSTAAEETLLSGGRSQGEAWTFPTDAGDALARLDPREPFAIQFLFRDGSTASATFEAGDFGAARAFVQMGLL